MLRKLRTKIKPTYDDYSNDEIETEVIIEPFEVEAKTGKILNPTKEIKYEKGEPLKVSELVNSFFYDSFSEAVKRVKQGQQEDLVKNKNLGEYLDLYNLPKNVNELKEAMENNQAKINEQMEALKAQQKQQEEATEAKKKEEDEKLKNLITEVVKSQMKGV